MELQTSTEQASFYCNRCDKWVDGIRAADNSPLPRGMGQVLCDECSGAILYKLPNPWKHFMRKTSQFLGNLFGPYKE